MDCPKLLNKQELDLKSLCEAGTQPPDSVPSVTWEPTHCLSVFITSSPLGVTGPGLARLAS